MEIVDELTTPGCPNCALKHLSAALALLVDTKSNMAAILPEILIPGPATFAVLEARALVNFMEAIEGYESHWDFGVGLLARAETAAIVDGFPTLPRLIRDTRCDAMLAQTREDRVKVVRDLAASVSPTAEAHAHIEEAIRELPVMKNIYHEIRAVCDLVALVVKLIKWVREEYFSDFETKENEEKGEEPMAMKKAAAKKAPAKAAVKKAPAKAAGKKSCKK